MRIYRTYKVLLYIRGPTCVELYNATFKHAGSRAPRSFFSQLAPFFFFNLSRTKMRFGVLDLPCDARFEKIAFADL